MTTIGEVSMTNTDEYLAQYLPGTTPLFCISRFVRIPDICKMNKVKTQP